jgi:hypothetical protein
MRSSYISPVMSASQNIRPVIPRLTLVVVSGVSRERSSPGAPDLASALTAPSNLRVARYPPTASQIATAKTSVNAGRLARIYRSECRIWPVYEMPTICSCGLLSNGQRSGRHLGVPLPSMKCFTKVGHRVSRAVTSKEKAASSTGNLNHVLVVAGRSR